MNEFGPVVDARWLAEHLGEADLVVVDVRWYLDGRSGLDAYDAGHIPSAVFADIDTDLSSPPTEEGGRHPLPSPEAFAVTMGRLGIGDSTRVVAYDDVGGVIAGRLWWMLDSLGRSAAILDGGIGAWTGPLITNPASPEPATFTSAPWPADRLMTKDQMVSALGSDTVILDARSADRYSHGGPADPRPGHIPGALSAPATDNLVEGRLADPVLLADRYRQLGADEGAVVAYCGSGVTACIDLIALRAGGLPDGKLFVGSWSAWGVDESLPNEVG